jgi:hypothetical protein
LKAFSLLGVIQELAMTLDAERLRGEAERRIESLERHAVTADDRRHADQVAKLIRLSLECRLKAASALAEFERLRASLRHRRPPA